MLKESGFTIFYDPKNSIGRRYRRLDECGVKYIITVDYDSLKKNDCTIRSRDTQKQIRVKIKSLKDVIEQLIGGEKLSKFGKYIY